MPFDNREILVVIDDEPARRTIADLLVQAGYTCRKLASGEEALSAAREHEPAAVVLAVVLPGMTGYDVCRALREEAGELLPIIFVSKLRTDSLDCVAGLLLGADDYIAEPFAPEELAARVRRAVTRGAALRSVRGEATHDLTNRELEVLAFLADGLTQETIAAELVISPKTVGTHIQRILAKLKVHSRAEAVAAAYQRGIVGGGRLNGKAKAAEARPVTRIAGDG
jgi:DNA-binding NarL/FixJ family response regulator